MSHGLALARWALSEGWSGRHHRHAGGGLPQQSRAWAPVTHGPGHLAARNEPLALLSEGARVRWAWGGGAEPKNNSNLTHSASNLTGLPARCGFACPIFFSIFSWASTRAISLLGWIERQTAGRGSVWTCLTVVPWVPDDRRAVTVTGGASSLGGRQGGAVPGGGKGSSSPRRETPAR